MPRPQRLLPLTKRFVVTSVRLLRQLPHEPSNSQLAVRLMPQQCHQPSKDQ
jgi:hypothetical protein